MLYEAFTKLVGLLAPYISKYLQQSHLPDKYILDEVKVALGIRWMKGSTYDDLGGLFDISQTHIVTIIQE